MALPTGTISLSDVDVYLGAPATQLISLNDTSVRTLAGIPSGTIAMSNLQGKPGNPFILNITTDQANYDVRVQALAAGWNGTDAVTVNIASGVAIYSSSTGSYAMTVDGAFPGGVTVNNSGTIVGMGGAGGGGTYSTGVPGSSGGPALFVGAVVTFVNNGTIASGGGGGGASYGHTQTAKGLTQGDTGGGGGGGQSSLAPASGGIPIPPTLPVFRRNGAPGASGTFAARGAGGVGNGNETATGGPGGVWGSSGAQGANFVSYPAGAPGGAAGTAINGYGLVVYSGSGTIYGPTSNGNETVLTISTPQTSTYNINTQATAAGWDGTKRLRVVINPGVSVVSASTGTAAMVATGAFPNALVITNNGYIVGKGGAGGSGGLANSSPNMTAGSTGGIGLSITGTTSAIYMVNNGTIGGGGGGGGGGRGFIVGSTGSGGGGGGGAGLGAGGPAGGTGATAGSSGTAIAGGSGGAGTNSSSGPGGPGGGIGSSGSAGTKNISNNPGAAGGSAGWAVYGDNLITYVTTGTIIGARQSTVANIPITSPQINLDALTLANASGWNGVAQVNLIISPGVTVSSASVGTPSLTISGTFPNGVTLTNNGTISGAGGNGGNGAYWYLYKGNVEGPATPGVSAGTALYVTTSGVPVTNNGTIAGGGGGGGGGSTWTNSHFPVGVNYWGGNGGGGGAGNIGGVGGAGGGGGSAISEFGSPGANGNPGGSTTGGSGTGGGATGGPGGPSVSGAGGALGSAGGSASSAGGAAGAAVVGTANITWLATGTRIGPIS